MDFWRMVVEHNVATMVVLSSAQDLFSYWPKEDKGKREFGYISVTHVSTEHRVAYVKREFTVYNQKVKETEFHFIQNYDIGIRKMKNLLLTCILVISLHI